MRQGAAVQSAQVNTDRLRINGGCLAPIERSKVAVLALNLLSSRRYIVHTLNNLRSLLKACCRGFIKSANVVHANSTALSSGCNVKTGAGRHTFGDNALEAHNRVQEIRAQPARSDVMLAKVTR